MGTALSSRILVPTLRLIASNLSQRYDTQPVFSGLDFVLGNGQALVVTGTNGSGKSTLLRTIAGLMRPSDGAIALEGGAEGASIAEQCHLIGPLDAVKPELTARENLTQWAGVLGIGSTARVGDALRRLGLERFADMPAVVLSTGWRRRLALARALVAPRPLWLLDEPTAALDLNASKLVSDIIRQHLEEGGLAVIATHLELGLEGVQALELAVAARA